MGCGLSTTSNPGPDPASQVLGDVQQAVGLIDGIYQLVAPAVLESKNKRNERDELKRLIGPWWDQAFQGGRCRIPVLYIDRFESHLQKTNGVLTPRGQCTADSTWGYFLHALAIHPEDDILTWKPAVGAPWDMRGDSLALDVRGRVFCHLVNLYRIEAPKLQIVSVDGKDEDRVGCRLSFGWLTWTTPNADHAFATFEPDTMHKLDGIKSPMEDVNFLPNPMTWAEDSEGELVEPPNDRLWQDYEGAWATGAGISDQAMGWPIPKATPLHIRLQSLMTNILKVMYTKQPLIITQKWLSDASSIKRRAMSNGGSDNAFLETAYTVLISHSRWQSLDQRERDSSKKALEACFFFDEDCFTIREPNEEDKATGGSRRIGIAPWGILESALEAYRTREPGSWKGQLYAARDLVLKVACKDRELVCDPKRVRVLDFEEGDTLWTARVHL